MLKQIIEEVVDTELSEKHMTATAKMKAKKMANKPKAKKIKLKKAKCVAKHSDRIKASKGKLVCKSDGKLGKGMSKSDKKARAKARNKSGISGS